MLPHGKRDACDGEQIAMRFGERIQPRGCEDEPHSPAADRLGSSFEQWRIVRLISAAHAIGPKHSECRPSNSEEKDGRQNDAADYCKREGPVRVMDLRG